MKEKVFIGQPKYWWLLMV